MHRYLLFLLIVALGYSQQINRCSTDEAYSIRKQSNSVLEKLEKEANRKIREYSANGMVSRTKQVIKIPVVVHIVYSNSSQNISDAQVQSQIDVLNEDYRKLNADTSNIPSYFKPLAADFEIEFCLATEDPSGNPTTGITRTQTTKTSFSTSDDVKSSSTGGKDPWPTNKYLNIWVCNLGSGLLGYAQFPWEYSNSPNTDGVVISYKYFGRGGTAQAPFNLGRTATHEVGHWLGLIHTFQGGCSGTSSSTCDSDGDYVCDTPPTSQSNYNCPSTQNTCTETPTDMNDMTMNYMDYVDDACMYMFTTGQKNRVYAAINQYRSWILNSSTATMCNPVTFAAGFNADETQICKNGSVQFTDASIGNPTSWQWQFPGGTPSSYTQQNPTVTYNSPGTYDVTLIVSDGTQSDTLTKTNYINVTNPPTGDPIPFTEDFEAPSPFFTNGWTIENPDNDKTWVITTIGGTTPGNHAAYMDYYNYNAHGERDAMVSKYLDLSNTTSPELYFEHAYALYSNPALYNYTDSLIIYVIDGCTNKQHRVAAYGESGQYELATVSYTTNSFAPSTAADWCTGSSNSQGCYILNLSQFAGKVIKLKIEGYNDYENNLYIDNINVREQTVNILNENTGNIKVYPSTAKTQINIINSTNSSLFGNIISPTGQKVMKIQIPNNKTTIDVSLLPKGLYIIELSNENGKKFVAKFVKI